MVKNSGLVLPLQEMASSFLRGAPAFLWDSEAIMRGMFADAELEYQQELSKARDLLNASSVRIGRHVISVKTPDEAPSNLMQFLMIRYINLCHHGKHPIVINGEVVYTPILMEGFEQQSVLTYINRNLAN